MCYDPSSIFHYITFPAMSEHVCGSKLYVFGRLPSFQNRVRLMRFTPVTDGALIKEFNVGMVSRARLTSVRIMNDQIEYRQKLFSCTKWKCWVVGVIVLLFGFSTFLKVWSRRGAHVASFNGKSRTARGRRSVEMTHSSAL